LLFAVGAVAALPHSPLRLDLAAVLLVFAAVLGDAVNYAIGWAVGPRGFSRGKPPAFQKKPLPPPPPLHGRERGPPHPPRAVHADHPDLCTVRRRNRQDELPPVRSLQRGGRDRLDSLISRGRLVVRRSSNRSTQLQARDPGDHRDLSSARRL